MPRPLENLPYGSYTAIRLDREVPLHALTQAAGHSREEGAGYSWDGRRRGDRPVAVLQVTLDGAGLLETGAERIRVAQGSAMLVSIPGDHLYRVDPASGFWEFVYAVLHGSEALRLIDHATRGGQVIPWDPHGPAEQQLYRLVEELRRPERASVYELSSRTYALAMSLFRQTDAGSGADSAVAHALDYLHENLAGTLTVEDLAGVAGYSRHHFARVFKAETGLAPVRYLREARCEKAAQLLATKTLSVKEIAARCGFESTSYFCRVFLQTTGFTPGDYRTSRP